MIAGWKIELGVDEFRYLGSIVSKEHSTTDALLYMLQDVYEAVDSGEAFAWLFFTDLTKGFDLTDHIILMWELAKLEVHPVLLKWIATFLTNRQQAVRIGGTLDWRTLKEGAPQRTKLGVIHFTVMTNKLLSDWRLRIKFVDDTTALEIVPRNSTYKGMETRPHTWRRTIMLEERRLKGLFTWRKEDLEGGTTLSWVFMQRFRSVWCPRRDQVRDGIKNGLRQKQKYNLGTSALFTGVNKYLSAELSQ